MEDKKKRSERFKEWLVRNEDVVAVGAYVTGAVVGFVGMYALIRHQQTKQQNELQAAWSRGDTIIPNGMGAFLILENNKEAV